MLAFPVLNSLPYLIWWWISVECKLFQNIKHIVLIIISSNNFEFPSDGDLIVINILIILFWLFFSLIRVRKTSSAANFSNFWGSIWNFRTLMLGTMTSPDCNIFPSLVSFFLFREDDWWVAMALIWWMLWLLLFIAFLNTPCASSFTGIHYVLSSKLRSI